MELVEGETLAPGTLKHGPRIARIRSMRNNDDLDKRPAGDGMIGAVPMIDLGDRASVGQIADACREWGFLQVVGHGIPRMLVEKVRESTHSFFALPVDQKERIIRTRENPWGYYNNELTKNQRDKKEVFDYASGGIDPVYGAKNRWPDFDADFRPTMEAYRDACAGLSLRLLEAMSEGLGVEARFLNPLFEPEHTGFIRLNYYPVADPMEGREDVAHLDVADLGVHHHTDAGALTVLLQDDVGGLQVYNDGLWYDVPPVDGAFVINTGDMMQVWSNDRYQAAIHRVLAMESSDRYSIPFFYNPRAGAKIRPLPSVVTASHPALYREIDWSDFRSKRTDGDYADYGAEVQIAQFRIDP